MLLLRVLILKKDIRIYKIQGAIHATLSRFDVKELGGKISSQPLEFLVPDTP